VVEQDSGMEILDWDDGESINDAIVDGISRKNDRRLAFSKNAVERGLNEKISK
jgi:hypothetical protein